MIGFLVAWVIPGVTVLDSLPVAVTPALQDSVKRAGLPPFLRETVWVYTALADSEEDTLKVVVDDVLGKHEPITFAVGIRNDTVRFVEVLAYREPYGGEIQNPRFLERYRGKTSAHPLRPGKDIPRIAGATISVNALTQGVRRALWLLEFLERRKDGGPTPP